MQTIEPAVNDVADEGRLTITVCTRQVEVTAAIDRTIAIIVSLTIE